MIVLPFLETGCEYYEHDHSVTYVHRSCDALQFNFASYGIHWDSVNFYTEISGTLVEGRMRRNRNNAV